MEPHLIPLDNEHFPLRSATIGDEARLDIKAGGFWRRGQNAFFDIWITHINSTRNRNLPVEEIFRRNEAEKSVIIWKELLKYTYLQNKRMRRCGVPPPPPPIIFERLKLPQQIIYRRKENLSESPNHQRYWENILVSRFYEQFSRNRRNLGHFRKFEKISNSQNMNILYIILKHVIWRFQIYNLFREIFKFREDKSNNVFLEIRKCFRKTAKFEFFAKQIIYLESPDHPLQNDI